MKYKHAIRILSIIILVSSFVIPIINLFPEGIIPDYDAWTTFNTFEAIADDGLSAFENVGVAFHFSVWLPAILLCVASFSASDNFYKDCVLLMSSIGVFSMSGMLIFTISYFNAPDFIDLTDGYLCFEYWIALVLFIVCGILAINGAKQKS